VGEAALDRVVGARFGLGRLWIYVMGQRRQQISFDTWKGNGNSNDNSIPDGMTNKRTSNGKTTATTDPFGDDSQTAEAG